MNYTKIVILFFLGLLSSCNYKGDINEKFKDVYLKDYIGKETNKFLTDIYPDLINPSDGFPSGIEKKIMINPIYRISNGTELVFSFYVLEIDSIKSDFSINYFHILCENNCHSTSKLDSLDFVESDYYLNYGIVKNCKINKIEIWENSANKCIYFPEPWYTQMKKNK